MGINYKILLSIILTTALWCCSSSLFSQEDLDNKGKKKFQKIKEQIRKKETDKAINELDKLLLDYPEFLEAYITKGNALIDLEEWDYAIETYNLLLEIDPYYHDERLWYTLAYAHRQLQQYDQAVDMLHIVIKKLRKDSRLRPQIELEIKQVKFLKQAYENPVLFEPIRMDSNINTEHLEYLPSFNADGSMVIFTRRIGENEELYIGNIINESTAVKPIETINTAGNEGAHILSPDGNLLIFTACDRKDSNGGCDLYISTRKNGVWTKGQRMSKIFNTRGWESQPSISSDGRTIYFSSDRPGGKGKKDIWYVATNEYGKFDEAKNLSRNINTKGNESSPFIHPDGKTLYFRSDTHPGMGDYDIFLSRKDSLGEWSIPINLGYPINTEKSEGALFVALDGKTAYFSSDQNTEPPQLDIFRFNLPAHACASPTSYLKARVTDSKTNKPLSALLEIVDLETNIKSKHRSNPLSGEVLTALPTGTQYAVNIASLGYLFYSKHISLDSISDASTPFILEIKLEKIPKEDVVLNQESEGIILENIFFETGSSDLLDGSIHEIVKLKNILTQNPNLKIKIYGHTDNVGNEEDNLILSENRALAVKEKLEELRINPERIFHEGLGETQAIATNETMEGRLKNRRTEFVIIY